jgi:DNA phosphorothioation-associated putative methyltransferase
MAVGVMLYSGNLAGKRYRDGFLTSRNTFQKYFSQDELKDYLEHVLAQEVFLVGPGIAYVFRDKDLEQRFNASRYRARGIATRILATRTPRLRAERPPRKSKAEQLLESARPTLYALWRSSLDLGRFPDMEEIEDLEAIARDIGGFKKGIRLLAQHYDMTQLAAAQKARESDLLLYLAMLQFRKRAPYKALEARLQRDIKAFFGDYKNAQALGMKLLADSAQPEVLFKACREAAEGGLGWLDGQHSLQLHTSMIDRLPVVLRTYVSCGLMLWGEAGAVQLVKFHISSGKLTLLEFDDFDSNPLPTMRQRIKINLRNLDYDVFEYGSPGFPKPLLYRKSRYLHEDYPGYAEQAAFDEGINATGILGDSDFGPSAEQLHRQLALQRLEIDGLALIPSSQIPPLDQPCGQHLTYRYLIECGETQKRLGISNLPLNPKTYNALYERATKILDPIIEYFGGIELSYGFCSSRLARNISSRIAPTIVQLAGCELNRHG